MSLFRLRFIGLIELWWTAVHCTLERKESKNKGKNGRNDSRVCNSKYSDVDHLVVNVRQWSHMVELFVLGVGYGEVFSYESSAVFQHSWKNGVLNAVQSTPNQSLFDYKWKSIFPCVDLHVRQLSVFIYSMWAFVHKSIPLNLIFVRIFM